MANDTTPQVGISLHGTGGQLYENIDTAKTLAEADNGVIQNVIADAITITLPATVVGTTYIIRNGGVPKTSGPAGTGDNGSVLVTIAPNASDKIMGAGFTSADNKAALNTKATAQVGDYMVLVGDGVNGWMVQSYKGVWARQA